ncbi:SCO family protein [Lysinibacillus piscis]|uniref:SCO1 protein n=1 Tax=Lysinibacillus piscis TaxID=2518931 RepID=A0ABQ5NL19_9BACI|nr:SCO family protein [Lysinibacillus sp. KH24]GLC89052.1 SCO1 protein [Lysinibacillus sp. KH24]
MKKSMLLACMLLISVILSACGSYQFKPELDIQVEDFTVTNQHNEQVSLADLKGKPWLAMFIFTSCTTICPPMTYNMTEIQKALKDKGLEDYQIVGFSVDPEIDHPQVLADYLNKFSPIDASKWQLFTGYQQAFIEEFAKNSFQSLVRKTVNSDQVTHMSRFYLVNADGTVVKDYNGSEDVPTETIVADMKALMQEK